jgi:hypothetical protein
MHSGRRAAIYARPIRSQLSYFDRRRRPTPKRSRALCAVGYIDEPHLRKYVGSPNRCVAVDLEETRMDCRDVSAYRDERWFEILTGYRAVETAENAPTPPPRLPPFPQLPPLPHKQIVASLLGGTCICSLAGSSNRRYRVTHPSGDPESLHLRAREPRLSARVAAILLSVAMRN